jgi:hypothetical protein
VLELPVIVGRSDDVELTIPHPAVSRQHCELFESGGRVRVRDLGSTNGTRVAGKKVPEAVLRPHDRFTIGPFTLVIDYQDERGEATLEMDDRAAHAGSASSSRKQSPAEEEPPSDWDDSDDAAGLWDESDSSGEVEAPRKPEARPSDTPRPEAAVRPPASAEPAKAKKPPQKIASSTTTTTPTSGPDPELGLDLDELLEGLEGLNLNDFLKGID